MQKAELNLQLEIGTTGETIEVTADVPLVNLGSATLAAPSTTLRSTTFLWSTATSIGSYSLFRAYRRLTLSTILATARRMGSSVRFRTTWMAAST
jgi:hypothetical protein